MSWLWKILFYFAGEYLKGQAILRAKRKGVVTYIHAVQGVRFTVMGLVAAFFIFHGILFAGFGALVTGMMLLGLEQKLMLQILFGIFLTLFLIPVLAIAVGLSERLWYKASGAQKLVENLRADRESEDSRRAA